MKIIQVLTIIAVIFYLTGAFMNASFNLGNWNPDYRSGIGISYLFIVALTAMFYGMSKYDQNGKV